MKNNYFYSNKKGAGIKALFAAVLLFTGVLANAQCNASFTTFIGAAGSATFLSTSTGTSAGTSYWWSFGDGTTSNAGPNVSHTYSVNGSYLVYMSISGGAPACYDSTSVMTVISNTANPPCAPVVSFNLIKDTLAMPAIVWDASPNYPPNVVAANWSWGDGTSTMALYPSHTFSAAGFYNICVSVTVACAGTASACSNSNIYRTSGPSQANTIAKVNVINPNPTAVKNNSAGSFNIGLFPNPTSGEFTLELKNASELKFVEVNIANIMGEIVYASKEEAANNNLSKKINLNNLSNGTYFVKINSASGSKISKLIINK